MLHFKVGAGYTTTYVEGSYPLQTIDLEEIKLWTTGYAKCSVYVNDLLCVTLSKTASGSVLTKNTKFLNLRCYVPMDLRDKIMSIRFVFYPLAVQFLPSYLTKRLFKSLRPRIVTFLPVGCIKITRTII